VNFLERAKPYAEMGIPVFPLLPCEKRPPAHLTDWPDVATTDLARIEKWNAENPDYNCGIVAKPDGVVFLEFDIPKGMPLAAQEMGQTVPKTRYHISGKGFTHSIFKQTDRSRALGNRQAALPEGGEWFSFRQNNRYVVGPGSIHPNGNEYGVARDINPIPVPDWVCDFVEKHTASHKTSETKDARPVAEDFDFNDLMEWYGIDIVNIDGEWHIAAECPVAGYRHEHSIATGFYWDGESLGFHCFAGGCDGASMSIGQVLRHLNKDHAPYPKRIWEEEELDLGQFVELEDVPVAVPLTSVFKNAIEKCPAGPGMGCQCGLEHVHQQSNLSDATRTGIAEALAPPAAPAVIAPAEQLPDEIELAKGEKDGQIMSLVAQSAASVKLERLEWLWPDRIPGGKITWYSGKPDCGKSLALLDLIARVTTGNDWPDGIKNEVGPRRVLLAASEDDLGTTLVPRLKAAGADLDKVLIIKRIIVENVKASKTVQRALQLKADARLLRHTLKKNPDIALVALDPITGYFGDADPNKDKEIRPVMEAVQDACDASKAAFVAIVHHNKRSDVDALGKILGGSSVAGVSRAAWGFSRDSENKDEFYMALVKSNLSKKRTGLKYKITGVDIDLPDGTKTEVPRTEWLGEHEMTANEVMDVEKENAKNGTSNPKMVMATLLIKHELRDGPKLAADMYKKRDAEGIDERTFKKAYYEVGVAAYNQGGKWWWQIPQPGAKSREQIRQEVAKAEDVRIPDDIM
jgi:putative DNA primase/helicase